MKANISYLEGRVKKFFKNLIECKSISLLNDLYPCRKVSITHQHTTNSPAGCKNVRWKHVSGKWMYFQISRSWGELQRTRNMLLVRESTETSVSRLLHWLIFISVAFIGTERLKWVGHYNFRTFFKNCFKWLKWMDNIFFPKWISW